ncbi:hypothetical protein R6Q57_015773 [Mikania cordata]
MEEEFQAAIYGGSWWLSPRTACNPSSCSSDIAVDMENLGPFWPENLMNLNSNSSDDSSDGSMVFQDCQKPTDWNQNFVSGVQEAMNNFSTTSDDGLVTEIEAEHQVFTVDHQSTFNIASSSTGCTTFPTSSTPYGYPLSLVQSLFINNSPPPSPPPPPPLSQEQPLYDYQSNSKYITLTGKLTDNTTFKRPRLETPSPLPTFKVRKEKLGDRITALQQLVSPFGKTDTASVLHDAIEYIKLLHDQVDILSAPYMKGASKQVQPIHYKVKDEEPHIQDLRSQGLCLVPVSGMFPVAPDMTTGLWTPSYEGSFN